MCVCAREPDTHPRGGAGGRRVPAGHHAETDAAVCYTSVAGGSIVLSLMIMPMARGLFSAALAMSPSPKIDQDLQSTEKLNEAFLQVRMQLKMLSDAHRFESRPLHLRQCLLTAQNSGCNRTTHSDT